jgi:GrpB-like predicted nucleotidyltransferase (UPF0157 family)
MTSVVVVDYDSAWPGVFEEIRARVWPAVSDLANRVEHVGSTAVPGLAAKPVIDIDVVAPPHVIRDTIARLEALGYEHEGDLGVPAREAFRAPPDFPRHHLYLCPEGSVALANHIALREHLRSSPSDARAYGDLKKRLAREFTDDRDGYGRGKTQFILRVLLESGLGRDLVDEISRQTQGPMG